MTAGPDVIRRSGPYHEAALDSNAQALCCARCNSHMQRATSRAMASFSSSSKTF